MTFTDMPTSPRSKTLRVLTLLLVGAGAWWWIESTRPATPPPNMERAGGSARPVPVPSETVAGPGASPLSTEAPAALVVPSSPVPESEKTGFHIEMAGLMSGAQTTDDPARRRTLRSPLEQSPGWAPPADPESMSVLTGRREAPLVPGDFEGGMPTLVSLVEAALDAARREDEDALHRLRATRAEFERFLWREFPQSRPVTNITAADAWSFMSQSSLTGANRAIAAWSGRSLEIVKIESSGRMSFTNFTMWRDVVVTARDTVTGEVHRISFLPAVVERHGRHKVFTYKD